MRRKLIAGGAVLGVLLLGGGYWMFRVYQREMEALAQGFGPVYDGVVLEPFLTRGSGEGARDVATSESWSDEGEVGLGEVRLEATLASGEDASKVRLELIHVGVDVAWEPTERFRLLADDKPVKVSFPKEEESSAYETRVLRGGAAFEERLFGTVSTADMLRFATARRAQVQVGKKTVPLSPKSQAVFKALLE
ncbi:hypothetical protein [Myxococcus landrumensis]|uniref:DUF4230 domain-containing protein n=1 Tax=Myxococcus landrumensis TaxID=2813577 RepID=A0ABX7N177_9BACT|nr:hypothetical protein [Myxococcus landrumus]QSQ12467.1 hypothetical protein JY572_29480 [Myxococcus landrumus]